MIFFLCVLSGLLLFLSFPPVDLGGLAWFAFIPLLIVLEKKTFGERFLFGFLTGFFFFLSSLFWLRHVTWIGLFLLSVYLALYVALFSVFSGFCFRRFPGLPQTFLIPAGWVALELLRSHLLTGFGWNLLGYSQWRWTSLLQIADTTGAAGISFLVMMGNVAFFLFWKAFREKKGKLLWPLGLAAALVFAACLYGSLTLSRTRPSRVVRIGIVQGNIPQSLKWDASVRELILSKYERLTQRICLNHPDIVFWPETSVPGILPEEKDLLTRLKRLAKGGKTFLLVGSACRLKEGLANSALLITPRGITQRYDKLHLVPYGEYIPFEKEFPFLRNWIVTGDFLPGKSPVVFDPPSGRFSVLICFEDIFPELARRFVKEGAVYLVNITNDAWFRKSAGPTQHAQASLFRAVENRVPIIRAANTGVSCVIDANGRFLGAIADEKGEQIEVTGAKSFTFSLLTDPPRTFYTRHGDLFAKTCALFALLGWIAGMTRAEAVKA